MTASLLTLLADMPMAALRLLAWVAVAAFVFVPLEKLLALRAQRISPSTWARDLGWYTASGLLPAFVLVFSTTLAASISHAILPAWWLAEVASWPAALALLLTLVVGDFAYYWAHRWSHEINLLWRFHAIHHEPEQVYWLVNTRVHPVDAAYTRTLVFFLVCLLGLSQGRAGELNTISLLAVLANRTWSTLVHANIRLRMTWVEGLISTPRFHHWHHARDLPSGAGWNYAALLPLWDRLFGSVLKAPGFPPAYGIAPRPENAAGKWDLKA